MKIELHKAFKVPIDGLTPIAEEIVIAKEKKVNQTRQGPYTLAQKDQSSDSEDQDFKAPPLEEQSKDKKSLKKELQKTQKKEVKVEKREKRKLKKELKLAFKGQAERNVKLDTVQIGAIKPGVSVKTIQ